MNEAQKWHLLQSKLKKRWIAEIFEKLTAEDIYAILIKGAAVEIYYPDGVARPTTDIDIAVSPADFTKVKELYDQGFLGRYNIDIHEGLRHFDRRDWETVFKRTRHIDLDGAEIRVLAEEDSLRLACIHWLTDGCEREDRLWDIFYLVQNRSEGFDWEYCLNSDGLTRRRWIVSAVGLAHHFRGLEIDDLSFADEAKALPNWLVATVEQRWKDNVKFAPLDHDLTDGSAVLDQIKRRFPPNAVMATVALEGEFDDGGRLGYQIRYFFKRLFPSMRRTISSYRRFLFRNPE